MKSYGHLRNEKGVALATVLVLSLISLAIVSTLVYMVIQGTRFAGLHKIYKTALEASYGGTEIATAHFSYLYNIVLREQHVTVA